MQIKVQNTRMQEVTVKMTDTQYPNGTLKKSVLVIEAKLVLIKTEEISKRGELCLSSDKLEISTREYNWIKRVDPVLITRTNSEVGPEKIITGDYYVDMRDSYKNIYKAKNVVVSQFIFDGEINRPTNWCFKVLALPHQFSFKHIQAIVSGKLKDGCTVLVECERVEETDKFIGFKEDGKSAKHPTIDRIKVSARDHVTIFKHDEPTYTENDLKLAFEAGREANPNVRPYRNFHEWFENRFKKL